MLKALSRITVTAAKMFKGKEIRLKVGQTAAGDTAIWLDLYGNSYSPAAASKQEALKFIFELEEAKKWVKEQINLGVFDPKSK